MLEARLRSVVLSYVAVPGEEHDCNVFTLLAARLNAKLAVQVFTTD